VTNAAIAGTLALGRHIPAYLANVAEPSKPGARGDKSGARRADDARYVTHLTPKSGLSFA
jgi:hypothetical protein